MKYAVQIPTFGSFESATGGSSVAYYGLQTAAFELAVFVVGVVSLAGALSLAHSTGGDL